MTEHERRRAARFAVPPDVEASVSGTPVTLLDLSTIGARIEHEERFSLTAPQLRITWQGQAASIPIRVVRSEIAGRRESRLIYHSGVQFVSMSSDADGVIASILRRPDATPPRPAPPPLPPPAFDDTWIRRVNIFREQSDDDLPFAQFRLTPGGWEKSYVASPWQPEDGFTIRREERDFDELQRTYEVADPETRRMMRIALEAKLTKR